MCLAIWQQLVINTTLVHNERNLVLKPVDGLLLILGIRSLSAQGSELLLELVEIIPCTCTVIAALKILNHGKSSILLFPSSMEDFAALMREETLKTGE